jgi:hypothetical protein
MKTQHTHADGNFGIETLEGREVMAGNVAAAAANLEPLLTIQPVYGRLTASLSNGSLTVTGDANNHGLLIEQLGNNKFKLTGKDYINGVPTTVNGQQSVVFSGVNKDFIFQLGSSIDGVVFQGKDANHPLKVARDVIFSGGGGNDGLHLRNVNVGRDVQISLTGTYTSSTIKQSTIGRNLSLLGGSGAETIVLEKTEIKQNLNASTNGGNDYFDMYQSSVKGSASVLSGDGEDSVYLTASTVKKDLTVNSGAGKDRVRLSTTQADQYFVDLGDGDDDLYLTQIKGKQATLNGAGGTDSLHGYAQYKLSKTPSILSFEYQFLQ